MKATESEQSAPGLKDKNNQFDRAFDFDITPEEARTKLEHLGFKEDMWDGQLDEGRGSHYTRALITVARSGETANLNNVYHMFPDKLPETEADRAAATAGEAPSVWNQTLSQHAGKVAFQGVMRAGDMLVTPTGAVIAPEHPSVPPEIAANAPEIPQDNIA